MHFCSNSLHRWITIRETDEAAAVPHPTRNLQREADVIRDLDPATGKGTEEGTEIDIEIEVLRRVKTGTATDLDGQDLTMIDDIRLPVVVREQLNMSEEIDRDRLIDEKLPTLLQVASTEIVELVMEEIVLVTEMVAEKRRVSRMMMC